MAKQWNKNSGRPDNRPKPAPAVEVMGAGEGDPEIAGATEALTRLGGTDIDIAIATARRYPRSVEKFIPELRAMALSDPEVAEGCYYTLKRKGKGGEEVLIQGESVRLAEMALCVWGNIRAGSRIIGVTPDGKYIEAQGVCHDLEKNVLVTETTRRGITTSDGRPYSNDMVGVTGNAAGSVALRNAIFRVIPVALVKPVFDACLALVASGGQEGDQKVIDKARRVITKLVGLHKGLTEERIVAAIGRESVEQFSGEDLTTLIGMGTAIKDGQQTADEAFPPAKKGPVPASSGGEEPPDEPGVEDAVLADGKPGGEKVVADLIKFAAQHGRGEPRLRQEAQRRFAKTLEELPLGAIEALEEWVAPRA